jgi:hypothetical protein
LSASARPFKEEVDTMDPELEQVIARLEARFDAALAREEEEAAADLALSLRQDRLLADLIREGGALRVVVGDGALSPVTVVGTDYCGTGTPLSCLHRLGSAPLLAGAAGSTPEPRGDSLQEVTRRWARRGQRVELGLETDGGLVGRLAQVGPDSLVLEGVGGRFIVPLWIVRSIRLVHEG